MLRCSLRIVLHWWYSDFARRRYEQYYMQNVCWNTYTARLKYLTSSLSFCAPCQLKPWDGSTRGKSLFVESWMNLGLRYTLRAQSQFRKRQTEIYPLDGDQEEWSWQVFARISDLHRFHHCTTQRIQPPAPQIISVNKINHFDVSYLQKRHLLPLWLFLWDLFNFSDPTHALQTFPRSKISVWINESLMVCWWVSASL